MYIVHNDQIASETNHVDDDNCSSMNTNTLGASQSRIDENGVMVSIRSVVRIILMLIRMFQNTCVYFS